MPQSKSAAKRLRQNAARRTRNRARRSVLKTQTRVFQARAAGGDKETALRELKKAASLLDRAAGRGVVKKNYAARNKSQLARAFNSM
ncbi:MAG: 30S ribosomal protein S20 [PVC group bacterium]